MLVTLFYIMLFLKGGFEICFYYKKVDIYKYDKQ